MSETFPVEIQSLSKTYRLGFFLSRKVHALQGLDLRIAPGQVYGLLGPNGAGKSTTLKILMNLVQASAGRATIYGLAPTSKEARRYVGFLPENPMPYEYLTGREFVHLAGQLAGLSGKALDDRVDRVLGQVEMTRHAGLHIRRYSKGMVQRIGLAQALVAEPRLLILDEPTSGLDPVGRRQIRDLILEERRRGTTVLFCTHIIPDVEALCDRVAVLVGGRLVKEGSVQELLTTQAPLVELVVEGLDEPGLRALGVPVQEVRALNGRLIIHVASVDSQPLAAKLIASGARLVQLQSVRFSLEELFLEALSTARQGTVGGAFE